MPKCATCRHHEAPPERSVCYHCYPETEAERQAKELRRDRDRLRDAIDRVMGLTDTGSQTYRHAARLYPEGWVPPGQLVSMIRETLLDYAGCNWPKANPEPLVSITKNVGQETIDLCFEAAKFLESMAWEPENPNPECAKQRAKLKGYALRIRLVLEEHGILASWCDQLKLRGGVEELRGKLEKALRKE